MTPGVIVLITMYLGLPLVIADQLLSTREGNISTHARVRSVHMGGGGRRGLGYILSGYCPGPFLWGRQMVGTSCLGPVWTGPVLRREEGWVPETSDPPTILSS